MSPLLSKWFDKKNTQILNFENSSIFRKVMAILSFKKFPKIKDF